LGLTLLLLSSSTWANGALAIDSNQGVSCWRGVTDGFFDCHSRPALSEIVVHKKCGKLCGQASHKSYTRPQGGAVKRLLVALSKIYAKFERFDLFGISSFRWARPRMLEETPKA
jgi:hypothetical protein